MNLYLNESLNEECEESPLGRSDKIPWLRLHRKKLIRVSQAAMDQILMAWRTNSESFSTLCKWKKKIQHRTGKRIDKSHQAIQRPMFHGVILWKSLDQTYHPKQHGDEKQRKGGENRTKVDDVLIQLP